MSVELCKRVYTIALKEISQTTHCGINYKKHTHARARAHRRVRFSLSILRKKIPKCKLLSINVIARIYLRGSGSVSRRRSVRRATYELRSEIINQSLNIRGVVSARACAQSVGAGAERPMSCTCVRTCTRAYIYTHTHTYVHARDVRMAEGIRYELPRPCRV